ncbi:MAG: S8 family serine peptidase [Burkholderiales bacterium]|nr:S8 family serine peptidase [Burkholderiales bacterium]
MRRLLRYLTLIACATLPLLPGVAVSAERGPRHAAPTASAEDPNGARVIVKYRVLGSMMKALSANTTLARRGPQMASTLGLRHGLTLTDGHIVNASTQVVFGGKGLSSAALAAQLAADPEVEYAVPDLRRHALGLPNDPLYASWPASAAAVPAGYTLGQWYMHAPDAVPAGGYTGASLIASINAVGAWAITTGSASVIVADIDTGALYNHPDLAGKLLPGRNFVSTTASIGNGWSADASDPGDYTSADQCGSGQAAQPSSWHGTQTSSIIGAATNNGAGMASVGYNVRVLPVRVLGPCGGYDSDIIAGMYWAGGLADPNTGDPSVPANPNPAKVINLSLGGSGSCPSAYITAINDLTAAGVTIIVAAGNADGTNGSEIVGTPANCPGVIAVGGLRNVGTKVGYSAVGSAVAISAPAGNCVNTTGACIYPILTALSTSATTPSAGTYSYSDTTNYSLGTSFSTPMVAGTAALMLSVNPALTPAQIKSMLQGSARPFPTASAGETTQPAVCVEPDAQTYEGECICTTSTCGAGMLDAGNAVASAAATAAPSVSIAASATTVTQGTSVTLTGTATAPGSGTITGYQWSITSGNAIASIATGAKGAVATFQTSGAGTFTAQLTVTASNGQSAQSSVTVTVNAPAAPAPKIVASAGAVSAGASVSFDGSGSTVGSPATITGYQWAITSGASLATITSAANASTATVATAGGASGPFTITLTVTDSLGRQASTTSTVTVTAVAPTASISTASTSATVGANVTFDGGASAAPSGRTIAGYAWSITAGSTIASISGSASASSVTVATSGAGTLTVQLTVTDSAGVADTKTSTVTIAAAPAPASKGGGGASSPAWVLGLLAAVALLGRRDRAA